MSLVSVRVTSLRRPVLLAVMSLLTLQGGISLAARLVSGDPDLAHPLLHLVSGCVGLALGPSDKGLRRYATGFGAAYLLLGIFGAVGAVDVPWLPLDRVDHAFHLALGSAILVLAWSGLPGTGRTHRAGRDLSEGHRDRARRRKIAWWLVGGWGTIALALALLAAPAELEGPTLLPISPGHALAALDALALLPLLAGLISLQIGLWRRRGRLAETVRRSPGGAALGVFLGGLGLGLLLASAFSTFFWWWAIGAALFQASIVAASVVAERCSQPA